MADEVKQVKVDNWGIYFLQRLKHFFNRTDYCDLTLQFQDNAQLKVHRLVLSACTEYFELLERTCEMYEDCLVMPEDLQADIVVPIVNFMYTGQLEFKMDLLERLYQCSEIMNMPVLTKLLDSHRPKVQPVPKIYKAPQAKFIKRLDGVKETVKSISATEIVTTTPVTYKRKKHTVGEATTVYRDKKVYLPLNGPGNKVVGGYREPSPVPLDKRYTKKVISGEPRPTRYELPEEFDTDNIFESSFSDISYASQPLLVHPETKKKYAKKPKLGNEASTSKSYSSSTLDIVPCKPVKMQDDSLFEDTLEDADMYTEQYSISKPGPSQDSSQLFDQIIEKTDTNITIETKNSKSGANLDHAKIISEVLKKYPHLVKSNKNIKLKILNTPSSQGKIVKKQKQQHIILPKPIKTEKEVDYTFETDVLDSKQAAKLISLGAENIEGPWICLICGTPGKAMNFTSYYKFRRHLVEVHREKPVLTICEYCGHKSTKRNYLLHHLYTKHGIEPPQSYHFPKCNHCNYIALSEALLVKHKMSLHSEFKRFRCNVCPAAFSSSKMLLTHIQNTGHKYTSEKKNNFQCVYCQRRFLRETNLCAHLKTNHKIAAIQDGIIDDSDDESAKKTVKSEPNANDFQELNFHYQIQHKPDGNINVVSKTSSESTSTKQTILNAGLSSQAPIASVNKNKAVQKPQPLETEYIKDVNITSNDTFEEIVMIDNTEYVMRNNQLVPQQPKPTTEEYILSDHVDSIEPATSMEFSNMQTSQAQENIQHANMILKNSENITEGIPIYVSNEEEYKALMASNQPIIFDSRDANKTLTVLTAPHAATLNNTNIDLNNTQGNDMMIIENNYPLNVSEAVEAVPTENSNIVVVYSHSVDGENKQFQLVNTQGLGAQFVQSSTIITQNFETITTSASVMNTNVYEITPVTVNHTIQEETNQRESPNNLESSDGVGEMPKVELSSNITTTTNNDMEISSTNQNQDEVLEEDAVANNNVSKDNEEISEDNLHSMSVMDISEEMPIEHTVEETVESDEHANSQEQNVTEQEETNPEITHEEEDNAIIESQTYTQPEHMETEEYVHEEQNISKATENMEEVVDQQQPEEESNNTNDRCKNIDETNGKHLDSVTDVGLVSHNIVPADDVVKTSQTINKNWTNKQKQKTLQKIPAKMTSQVDNRKHIINQQESVESSELEESIENIQQELDKQVAVNASVTQQEEIIDEASDVANSSQDESEYVHKTSIAEPLDPEEAQEKISSLLNEWEDNDSQECGDSANEDAPQKETVVEEAEDATKTKNPEKQDKIKILVSDWDDDDEENKE